MDCHCGQAVNHEEEHEPRCCDCFDSYELQEPDMPGYCAECGDDTTTEAGGSTTHVRIDPDSPPT